MIRGHVLLISIAGVGIALAAAVLLQMWLEPFAEEFFLKIMGSLLVAGGLISFLIAVDYDLPNNRARLLLIALAGLAIAAAGLMLVQIWAQALAWALFSKIIVTLGILFVLLGFLTAVGEDVARNKKLRDENYMN